MSAIDREPVAFLRPLKVVPVARDPGLIAAFGSAYRTQFAKRQRSVENRAVSPTWDDAMNCLTLQTSH